MIQRIQTVFLLLSVAANTVFVFLPLFRHAMQDPSGWVSNGLITALAGAVLLSLVAIFMFNNRPQQIQWVKRAMVFQILALGACIGIFFTAGRLGMHLLWEAAGVGLIVAGFVLQYLAIHFIHKDEELVQSMDRIR